MRNPADSPDILEKAKTAMEKTRRPQYKVDKAMANQHCPIFAKKRGNGSDTDDDGYLWFAVAVVACIVSIVIKYYIVSASEDDLNFLF
mmetsp:Transcript_9079/g.12067  ORF Transcript_9079/g.12067 Transcript_9079/m.12067 type:complete len:88 (-) Transcript_9079:14-277(-)